MGSCISRTGSDEQPGCKCVHPHRVGIPGTGLDLACTTCFVVPSGRQTCCHLCACPDDR